MSKTNVLSRSALVPSVDWSNPADVLAAPFATLAGLLLTWQDRICQRDALDRMSTRQLEDIGLTRADVAIEVRKPFWLG